MKPTFHFGGFVLDPDKPSLTRGSSLVELAPKALQVLSVLVTNAGEVVTKDDLLNLVWPKTVVEEGNLAVHVWALRRALAEGNQTCNIETVPKLGYRFAGPVRSVPKVASGLATSGTAMLSVARHYVQQNEVAACRRATSIFRKCIELDPSNVEARAGLADALLMRFILGELNAEEGPQTSLRLLAEAKVIDPTSSDVHISISRMHWGWAWQWERASDELQHGIELARDDGTRLSANIWNAVCESWLGDANRGLQQLKQASFACPLFPHIWYFLVEAHLLSRDFYGAAVSSGAALELHPHCWYLHEGAAKAATMLGEYKKALRHLRLARLLSPEAEPRLLAAAAYVHAVAGNKDHAARLLARVPEKSRHGRVSYISLATAQAALGDKHHAVQNIEAAFAEREWFAPALKRDCAVDTLRADSRFRSLLARNIV
jgi:DNA-binding winged helix-turn-helix (wHTH) protein